eukprot:1650921-Rhodomonas_salina.6
MPSRSRQGGSLSPLLQPSNSRALIPSVRSLRSMVGRATGPSQQQPDGPSSPLGAAHGPSVNCSGSAFGMTLVRSALALLSLIPAWCRVSDGRNELDAKLSVCKVLDPEPGRSAKP